MRNRTKNNRRWIFSILSLACIFGFAVASHADTPPVVPGVPVVEAPALPATPPAVPGQQQLPPVLPPKREDEPVVQKAPGTPEGDAAAPTTRPTVFQRALAHLQTREGVASGIAQRDQQIATLQQQLGERDQTITQLTQELTSLRAGHAQIEQALNRIEGEQRTVADTVAAIGFDTSKLPAAGSLEQALENTPEGIQAKLKEITDPVQRAEFAQRIIALRDAPKK